MGNTENSEGLFKLINECIHEIHYGDDVYNRVDISDKDIEEFIDQFTGEQFEKVTEFFQTMPKLSHKVSIINPKTNITNEVNQLNNKDLKKSLIDLGKNIAKETK